MVAPTGLGLYSNTPTNQNLKTGGYGIRPYETTRILLTPLSFRPKINGPRKERPREERSLPSANTGRAPSGMGGLCSHSLHWATKNLFPKRFLRSFFLKKATLRARRRPPRRSAPRPQAASPNKKPRTSSYPLQNPKKYDTIPLYKPTKTEDQKHGT